MKLSLQLPILLWGKDQPHAPWPANCYVGLDLATGDDATVFSPSLLHLDDLVGSREGQMQGKRSAAIFFEKADLPAIAAHKVHQHPMLVDAADCPLRTEVSAHNGIVGLASAETGYLVVDDPKPPHVADSRRVNG